MSPHLQEFTAFIMSADSFQGIACVENRGIRGQVDLVSEANARLIAAAPELLAALQRLSEKTKRANEIQHSGGEILPEDWSELYQITNEARAAILKATEGI